LKFVSVSILAILILVQPLARIGILASFQLNKDYVARNLCEKKSVKGNSCQGKCHLKKQLKKAEESEKKSANGSVELEKQMAGNPAEIGWSTRQLLERIPFRWAALEQTQTGFGMPLTQPPPFLS
jgi:hypothetical protein